MPLLVQTIYLTVHLCLEFLLIQGNLIKMEKENVLLELTDLWLVGWLLVVLMLFL